MKVNSVPNVRTCVTKIAREEIKRITRAGMGRCQGLICRDMLIKEIAQACDKNVEDIFPIPTFRPPIKPLRLSIIAGDKDD